MLGVQYGYYKPSEWKTAYYADVILDCWVDILEKTNGLALSPDATREQKEKMMVDVIEKYHVPALNLMEKLLEKHGGKYIAGDELTIADCAMVANLVNIWENKAGPWNEICKPYLAKYSLV